MYSDAEGVIYKVLKYFLQETLDLIPIIILIILFCSLNKLTMTPVATWPKAWVYGRSLAGIVDSNASGGVDVCLLWVLCVAR
jgi:hypothetical protein